MSFLKFAYFGWLLKFGGSLILKVWVLLFLNKCTPRDLFSAGGGTFPMRSGFRVMQKVRPRTKKSRYSLHVKGCSISPFQVKVMGFACGGGVYWCLLLAFFFDVFTCWRRKNHATPCVHIWRQIIDHWLQLQFDRQKHMDKISINSGHWYVCMCIYISSKLNLFINWMFNNTSLDDQSQIAKLRDIFYFIYKIYFILNTTATGSIF